MRTRFLLPVVAAAVLFAVGWAVLPTAEPVPRHQDQMPGPPSEFPRGYSVNEAKALLKTDQPVADDATVEQWIDEHRMKKYGA